MKSSTIPFNFLRVAVTTGLMTGVMTGVIFTSGCAKARDHSTIEVRRPLASFRGDSNRSVLIFNGDSIWVSEADSIESILQDHRVSYQEVDSKGLDQMTLDQITSYGLLIIPGGYAPTVTASLSHQTHEILREAVQDRGMNYLGFCAGAWLAVAPAPPPGQDVSYGLGLIDGPLLTENYLEKEGFEFKIVPAEFPGGSKRNLLWYGGPITPEISGGVVARYPDGTPAITQVHSGLGFLTLSGLHPTATPGILSVLGFSDLSAVAPDFTWALLDSSMSQQPLPTFNYKSIG
jgi:glutamine amidotransferase-like uncharacterized protein